MGPYSCPLLNPDRSILCAGAEIMQPPVMADLDALSFANNRTGQVSEDLPRRRCSLFWPWRRRDSRTADHWGRAPACLEDDGSDAVAGVPQHKQHAAIPGRMPPAAREPQPWTAQAARKLEHRSHQAYIGTLPGSLRYGFGPYNTGHESKSALCTLCRYTDDARLGHCMPVSAFGTEFLITFGRELCRAPTVYSIFSASKGNPSMIDPWKAASGINRCG
ncbi:hypothetical protein CCMA1212_002205 [Trichoderma ghanense]|uniref:Uncharacterized protein n=1 Tax=Trichoderma ghanense TaxID=65468 RepID=A0ABY2HCR9_9HYPO